MRKLLVKRNKFKSLSEMFSVNQSISIIAGPCSIESLEQMESIAQTLVNNKVGFIRGGAYKPRTSPYDFQGLGLDGLKILDYVRKKYNLLTVSEILDPRDVETALNYIDVIQIGSRNMTNFSLLKEVGKTTCPILIKRGMMSTYEEFLNAAEYVLAGGNPNIIMCERGIRTFETITRNTLDIAVIAMIKYETSLPIIVDLSHSLGRKDILLSVLKSLLSLGIDGVMVELHPNPQNAKSDKEQQLDFQEFEHVLATVKCNY